jgi:hypothetical protein
LVIGPLTATKTALLDAVGVELVGLAAKFVGP